MARLLVPITICTSVIVNTDDPAVAVSEAQRIAENYRPDEYFIQGWNDVQRETGQPAIHSLGHFEVLPVNPERVISPIMDDDVDDDEVMADGV